MKKRPAEDMPRSPCKRSSASGLNAPSILSLVELGDLARFSQYMDATRSSGDDEFCARLSSEERQKLILAHSAMVRIQPSHVFFFFYVLSYFPLYPLLPPFFFLFFFS